VLQRLVHWATAPPPNGEVQTSCACMVYLIAQYRQRQNEAGMFARTLDRKMGILWPFVLVDVVTCHFNGQPPDVP
jgi:hypothetical protein